MQGLWVKYVTEKHRLAYDPAVGQPAGTRWQYGAIVYAYEGEWEKRPPAYEPEHERHEWVAWRFYDNKTVNDLIAYLPMGAERTHDGLKGGIRLKIDGGVERRLATELGEDIKFNGDTRD